MTEPTSPFDSLQGLELTADERLHGWKAIQAHMQAHPVSSLETMPVSDDTEEMEALFADARSQCLSAEEKSVVFAAIKDEADAAPLFAAAKAECLGELEKKSAFSALQARIRDTAEPSAPPMPIAAEEEDEESSFFRLRWMVPSLAIVVLAAGGAGISYASENALPGEFLYPIKQMNEEIGSGIKMGSESKAEAETSRADRRLSEAQKLQSSARLTDALYDSIDQSYRKERRQAIEHIQVLEAGGNAESAARLRARLYAVEDRYQQLTEGRTRRSSSSAATGRVSSFATVRTVMASDSSSSLSSSITASSVASAQSSSAASLSASSAVSSVGEKSAAAAGAAAVLQTHL